MKLLLDENLISRLPALLADIYPGSSQVDAAGLRGERDAVVWEYAKANGYVIVSKDNDFRQRSFQYGAPPKVVTEYVYDAVGNILEVRRNVVQPPQISGVAPAAARHNATVP